MKSRALSLATVTILAGLMGLVEAGAENLDAGKPPAKIFADTCSACHKSSRGLLKTVPAISLPGFLRQHYTTSGDMASALSSYLLSSGGAADRVAETPKSGKKDAKQEQPKETPAAATAQGDTATQGKKGKQAARTDVEAKSGEVASDKSAKLGAKSRRGKKGAPVEETAKQEPPKDQTRPTDAETATAKSDAGKSEAAKSEANKSDEAKPDATKPDAAKPSVATAEPSSAPEKSSAEKSTEPAAPGAAASAPPTEGATPQEGKAGDTKAREASLPLPPLAMPTSNPRPAPRPMLTLPGFPAPVADTPADAPAAPTAGAEPAAAAPSTPTPSAPAATDTADEHKADEQKSASSPEPPKADTASPAKPNAAKSVAEQAAESPAVADSPKLDIIQEESHGPGSVTQPKSSAPRKKRGN